MSTTTTKTAVETTETMTRRAFLTAAAETFATMGMTEHSEFALGEIAKLDATNEKRREKSSKAAEANKPLVEAIQEQILTKEFQTASDIAVQLNELFPGLEKAISTQKASAILTRMDGIRKEDIKIKGKGVVKGYALADESDEVDEVEDEDAE